MDFFLIISTLLKWGALAVIGGFILLAFLLISYHFVYRKIFHGTRQLVKSQWLLAFLLCCWFLVVFALTTLSRGSNYTGSLNIEFFSSYINAWNQWSVTELQLILFNMLMFVPLGVLLPLLWNKAGRFSVTAGVSFAVTLFIELVQLITGRGIFELDDLLHNFLGSLFGYFCVTEILSCWKQRKILKNSVIKILAIPCAVGIVIGGAILIYENQPYGNMPILPAEKQDMSDVEVTIELSLNSETDTASIFKNSFANNTAHMQNVIDKLSEFSDIAFSGPTYIEDENKIVLGKTEDGTDVQLNYTTRTGAWQFNSWKEWTSLSETEIPGLRQKYESWLTQNAWLPSDFQFSIENQDTLRWECPEQENLSEKTKDFAQGTIMIQFDEDRQIAVFGYQMMWNQYIATESIISPEQAYQQILDGNFEQYVPFQTGDKLCIESYELSYIYDTKGYYQPVYHFSGYINTKDNPWECRIPALTK